MFALLLLFSTFNLSSSTPFVTSTTGTEHAPLVLFGRALPGCMNVAQHRDTQDIVWSCLATIFACTWVAIHPNLPGPGDSACTRFKRRVFMMIYALLAPELTVLWALRQRIAAGRIMREYNKTEGEEVPWYRYLWIPNFFKLCWMNIRDTVREWFEDPRKGAKEWTLSHGFFVQMGGFILYDGEIPKRVLRFGDLQELIATGEVDSPMISEHAINDRSKGDFLTKLVVVIQTSWFIFQCLARWASHLPVTELEVVTLAFAALNIVAYGLWWKKPQDVLVAVEVQLKWGTGLSNRQRLLGDGDEKEGWITRELRRDTSKGWIGWSIGVPLTLLNAIARPVFKVAYVNLHFEENSLRVPMFHSEGRDDKHFTLHPTVAIGVLFGGLHLIPWSSSFPTTAELWLWRSSALFITGYPVIAVLFDLVERNILHYHYFRYLLRLVLYLNGCGYMVYTLARLALLSLAFVTLRALPQEAYLDVEWTTFIPHI